MASYYTTESFLTLTPCELLQRYFCRRGELQEFPWDGEFTAKELREAIATGTDFKQVELAFRTIHAWANELGIHNLIEQARSPLHGGLEIGEELGGIGNEYGRAMYVWLTYPDVFRWAIELSDWEKRKGKIHYYVGEKLPCNGDDEVIRETLGEAIAAHFKKQAKGSRCQVEYYTSLNPVRHYFVANPEDSVKGYRAYDEKDRIVLQAYRPIFQVVFEYNPEDGDLTIHARTKKAKEKMFEAFCTNVLGFKEPPNAETEVFDLACLKNPDFRFTEDAAMPVESVTLRMAMLSLKKGAGRRVTLEASPYQSDHRQVEAMMFRSMLAHDEAAEDVIIEKAKIEMKFRPVNLKRMRPITFTVGAPQFSTLSDDDKSELAKAYLKKWGMLRKHKVKKEPADAA